MSHKHATLEDTVYFWFAANDTSGSGGDGASPVYDVRLAGAAAGAAPVLSGSATLLSHGDYPAGAHEVAVAATAGNGFAATNTYGVFCTLAVDSQNPTGFVGSFTLGPIIADITHIHGSALTETAGQLAGRFSDFFDAAAVTFQVDTALSSFKATGFATPTNVTDAHATTDGKIDTVDGNVDAILLDTGTDGVVGVTGNVNGKVLGGGATAITGLGVHAQDYQGNPIATASDLNTVKSHTIDWTDGGRLDLLLDQVLEDTGTTLPASIAAVQTDLDTITDDGVKLADGVTHGGTTALLSLKTIAVAATGADVDAVTITSAAGHDFAFTANKDVIHVTSCVDFIEIDACQQIIAAVACTGTGIQITTTGARAMYIQSTHASGIAAHYSGTSKGVAMSGQDSNGLAVDSFSGSAIGLASGVTNDIDGVLATVADVTTKTGYALATTGLDTALIDGVVASTYFAYMGATLTGKLSGVSANSPVFKAPDGSTTRVAATTSADGRTTVTLTPPA